MKTLTPAERAQREYYRSTILGHLAAHCSGQYYGGHHVMTGWTMLLSSDAHDPDFETVRVMIAPRPMPGEAEVAGTHEDLKWRGEHRDAALAASRVSIGRFRRYYPPFVVEG